MIDTASPQAVAPDLSTERVPASPGRLDFFDGLRGVAALVVAVYHFMLAFRPAWVPEMSATVPWWADSPAGILYNGNFSVSVFFVLSGFVLSRVSSKPRNRFVLDLFLRYLRLAIPAIASVMLAWALLTALPSAAQTLDRQAPSPWLVGYVYQGLIPSAFEALRHGAVGVFLRGSSSFNNVLWTMRLELIGSFGVYFFFQFVRSHRAAAAAGLLIVLVTVRAPAGYVAFALGTLLYLFDANGGRVVAPGWLFVAGLLLGALGRGFADRHGMGGWSRTFQPGNRAGLVAPLAATLIVGGLLGSVRLQAFFSMPICRLLGRLSFPLYLVHVPLLYTVVAAAAVRFQLLDRVGWLLPAFLALALTVAWCFDCIVDRPLMSVLRNWAKSRPVEVRS